MKDEVRRLLIARTKDPTADLRHRIEAGKALGVVGDPRFERRVGAHGEYLLPPVVEIPGGNYPVGSRDGHYRDEEPVHDVALDPFRIGRFPVTNAEYRRFVDARGYEDDQWWDTEAARGRRRGGLAQMV